MNDNMKVIVYGATVGAKIIIQLLEIEKIEVVAVCDRAEKGILFYGKKLIKPSELKDYSDVKIVIALTRSYTSAVETLKVLNRDQDIYDINQLLENKNIFDFIVEKDEEIESENFLRVYELYHNNKKNILILPTVELFITEKCTLQCLDCTHLITYYKKPKNLEIEKTVNALDRLLGIIEYIENIFILGGEPFLHPKLIHLLEYLGKTNKIGSITILTNGTIVPNEECIKKIHEMNIRIRISDYEDLSNKKEEIIRICKKNDIRVYTNNEAWVSLGNVEKYEYKEDYLKKIFSNCPFSTENLLVDGKLYRCAHSAHMQRLQLINTTNIEYVDILNEKLNNNEVKENLDSYMRKTLLESCNWCKGYDSKNLIERAIQKNKK